MKIITQEEAFKEDILAKLKKDVFIYPTDTIYGIGCNALREELVQKIREIKNRFETPFSIIAPSKKWILDNCEINELIKRWLNKLPGKYTFILNLKNMDSISKNISWNDTIGVRIPNHWISNLVERLGVPIVTTYVNLTGERFMTCLEDLNKEIKEKVDYVLYEGKKAGNPSEIVDFRGDAVSVTKRK